MKVCLAEDYGFCFGVKRAVDGILKALESDEVVTDGDVVHNERVMDHLKAYGLKVVKDLKGENFSDAVFAVRAHGIPQKKYEEISKRFKKILDLTCPIVKNLFEIAKKLEDEGYELVVFGKDGHAEMEALKGYVRKVRVVREAFSLEENVKRVAVVSQTTSSWKDFSEFLKKLVEKNFNVKEWKFVNTICRVTVLREGEAERLGKLCDLVVVIGGKHSANTEKLYSIANNYTKTLWISSPDELNSMDLSGYRCVGILSGTSTPKEDVDRVYRQFKEGLLHG